MSTTEWTKKVTPIYLTGDPIKNYFKALQSRKYKNTEQIQFLYITPPPQQKCLSLYGLLKSPKLTSPYIHNVYYFNF